MKNLKFIQIVLVSLIITSCGSINKIQLTDGTYITERKFKRIAKKCNKDALKKLTEDEKKIIKSTSVDVNFN